MNPALYRPAPGEIPTSAGVYRFRDPHGRVIYVGKAKNLRSRLTSYFADPATLHDRTRRMVYAAAEVDWTVVSNEMEALQLEYSWIKEYDPRFNVKYRDDKSYPWLAVTLREQFPRVQVLRGAKKAGNRYFGPYTHAWAIRETVDLMLRVFPVRTCSAGVFRRAQRSGRPCLLAHIDKCSAPCVGEVSESDHRAIAEEFCAFMDGDTDRFAREIEAQMLAASARLDYETAARRRDDLQALQKVVERSAVVFSDNTDADVFAIAGDELEAAVQVFHVRAGRIRGQRGWVTEKVEPIDDAALVHALLVQVYGDADAQTVPKEVLVPTAPTDTAQVAGWLSSIRGSAVDVRVPQRGDKRALAHTVLRNAEQALVLHQSRRASDLTTRSQALDELASALDLPEAPLRIECFDISHLHGTEVVGSMVVFEDGAARKRDYRKFNINGRDGIDDVAAIREVISRRFKRYLTERDSSTHVASSASDQPPSSAEQQDTGFRYPPSLVVVDGARPQATAAHEALTELGIHDIAVVGLAKRLEEVWLPDEEYPVILPRTSQGLYLLQRIRDEAHRFAITFHRSRRSTAMTKSALDTIPGLGPAAASALIQQFGSVANIRAATAEELCEVPGIGPKRAQAILAHLAPPSAPSINMTTGEVLDDDHPPDEPGRAELTRG